MRAGAPRGSEYERSPYRGPGRPGTRIAATAVRHDGLQCVDRHRRPVQGFRRKLPDETDLASGDTVRSPGRDLCAARENGPIRRRNRHRTQAQERGNRRRVRRYRGEPVGIRRLGEQRQRRTQRKPQRRRAQRQSPHARPRRAAEAEAGGSPSSAAARAAASTTIWTTTSRSEPPHTLIRKVNEAPGTGGCHEPNRHDFRRDDRRAERVPAVLRQAGRVQRDVRPGDRLPGGVHPVRPAGPSAKPHGRGEGSRGQRAHAAGLRPRQAEQHDGVHAPSARRRGPRCGRCARRHGGDGGTSNSSVWRPRRISG